MSPRFTPMADPCAPLCHQTLILPPRTRPAARSPSPPHSPASHLPPRFNPQPQPPQSHHALLPPRHRNLPSRRPLLCLQPLRPNLAILQLLHALQPLHPPQLHPLRLPLHASKLPLAAAPRIMVPLLSPVHHTPGPRRRRQCANATL